MTPLANALHGAYPIFVPLRAVIVGIGSALSDRFYGSSAVVLAPTGKILIDCPDSILRALRCSGEISGISLDPLSIHDILLTHLHGDHANGLEAFAWKHWLARRTTGGGPAERPRIHGIASVVARLWERLAPSMGQMGTASLSDYFDLCTLVPGTVSEICGAAVSCRETDHGIPCAGFRIRADSAELAWSGDTRFDPSHVDWLCEADCVVHETTESPVHTPIECLNALPVEIRRKMRLIHMDDDFAPAATDIVCLAEGDVLEVAASSRRPMAT